jgi:hypothetical protein
MDNKSLYKKYTLTKQKEQKDKYIQEIKNNSQNYIENYLKNLMKNNYDEFIDIFEKTNCVISGSFVLQAILGEQWEDSDIDMYSKNFDGKFGDNLISFFELRLNCNLKLHGGYLDLSYYKQDKIQIFRNGEDNGIEKVFETIFNEKKMQFVNLKKLKDKDKDKDKDNMNDIREIEEQIKLFDFDICKNTCYIKNKAFIVNFTNLKEIFEKKFKYIFNGNLKTLQRVGKYENRGFNIVYNKEKLFSQIKNDLEEEHKKCGIKYREYIRDVATKLIAIHETELNINKYYNNNFFLKYQHHPILKNKIKIEDINDEIIQNHIFSSIESQNAIDSLQFCEKDCIMRILDKTHFHIKCTIPGEALEHIFVLKEKNVIPIVINTDEIIEI